MQSTNYRYLKSGENVLPSDEIRLGDRWVEAGESCLLGKNTEVSELAEREMWYRRRLPHSGDVQFLMTVSIMVPVVVNCDGKTQEEIEDEAGRLAVEKILSNPREHIHFENIDWGACGVDEIQPEPKNPGKYRYLEIGEVIETGDELFKIDIAQFEPIENGFEWMIGSKFSRAMNQIRRPIAEPQYRPFMEGDVIEEGDQWFPLDEENWRPLRSLRGSKVADKSIINNPAYRKLIK